MFGIAYAPHSPLVASRSSPSERWRMTFKSTRSRSANAASAPEPQRVSRVESRPWSCVSNNMMLPGGKKSGTTISP